MSQPLFPAIDGLVFILESPDVGANLAEGKALAAALELAGISNHYYAFHDEKELTEVFKDIALHSALPPSDEPFRVLPAPHFHFSAHGTERGLLLANGGTLDWASLRKCLLDYAIPPLGKHFDREHQCCRFPVMMSSCKGINARKMFDAGPPYPCIAVVGTDISPSWADCLTAYVAFYNLIFKKDKTPYEAVGIVNTAIDLPNAFHCFDCTGAGK